ncbi:MAG: hypothetical protein KA330_10520 [Chitinophagaceae bacterium]|nr:hypothetical protein [Chitinophagaceae bacterium]
MSKIHPDVAKRIHRNYVNDPDGGQNTTQAVIISIKEAILEKHGSEKGNQLIQLLDQIGFDTLVCYFGRYDASDGPTKQDRNTIIVHLANTDMDGSVTVIDNEIYNFGDLKPPKTPRGEQVKPVD